MISSKTLSPSKLGSTCGYEWAMDDVFSKNVIAEASCPTAASPGLHCKRCNHHGRSVWSIAVSCMRRDRAMSVPTSWMSVARLSWGLAMSASPHGIAFANLGALQQFAAAPPPIQISAERQGILTTSTYSGEALGSSRGVATMLRRFLVALVASGKNE